MFNHILFQNTIWFMKENTKTTYAYVCMVRDFITWQGTPAQTVFSGKSLVTTAPYTGIISYYYRFTD